MEVAEDREVGVEERERGEGGVKACVKAIRVERIMNFMVDLVG